MLLSVIIPTLNRYPYLRACLHDLQRQRFTDYEVIIVDQSDEEQREHITEYEKVRTVYQVEKSASRARNAGLVEAKGEIALFLDDDIVIENPDFLANHVRHYSNSQINGVAGAILNVGKEFTGKRHKWSYKPGTGWLFFPINYDKECFIESAWAGNFSIRRELALRIGGMDENFAKGAFREEADFCFRYSQAFGPFVFDPAASIVHIGAPSGGIRAFATPAKKKAQQHYDGQFYFLFKNISFRNYFYHFVSAYLYFVHNKFKWYDLSSWMGETKKCIRGISNAKKMIAAGPKYISNYN